MGTKLVFLGYRANLPDLVVYNIHLFCYKECLYNLFAQIIIDKYDTVIPLRVDKYHGAFFAIFV